MQLDAIVVGGSFAGLSAAMQLARARRRVLVIDAGRPRNRFATSSHGFFGQDGRSPEEIKETARTQLAAYPTVEFVDGEASRAEREKDGLAVTLASGKTRLASRLILAFGIVDDLPEVKGVRERWGRTVLHCPYCHGYEVAGQRFGVLATSEMSIHQALMLLHWGSDITVFTNDTLMLTDDQRAALRAGGIRIEERPIETLLGEAPALDGVKLRDGHRIALDALFTGSRTRMASPLAEQLGCAFDDGPFGPIIRTDAFKETTVPGVYAAGDAARAPHNATWASADGVTAGIAAHRALVMADVAARRS